MKLDPLLMTADTLNDEHIKFYLCTSKPSKRNKKQVN
jgi:hypothetical protein